MLEKIDIGSILILKGKYLSQHLLKKIYLFEREMEKERQNFHCWFTLPMARKARVGAGPNQELEFPGPHVGGRTPKHLDHHRCLCRHISRKPGWGRNVQDPSQCSAVEC